MYTADECLMISGLQHFRFCRRQWALICAFIANPRAFGDVTLDVEPTLREHEGHTGY